MTTWMEYKITPQKNTLAANASIIFSPSARKCFTSAFNGAAYRENFVLMGGQRNGRSLFIDSVLLVPNKSRATHRLRISHSNLAECVANLPSPLVATAHSHSEIPTPSPADSSLFSCFPESILHLIVRSKGESLCLSIYQFFGEYSMPMSARTRALYAIKQEKTVTPQMKKEHAL